MSIQRVIQDLIPFLILLGFNPGDGVAIAAFCRQVAVEGEGSPSSLNG